MVPHGAEAIDQYVHAGGNLLPLWLTRFASEHTRRAYRTDLEQFYGTDYVALDSVRRTTHLHVDAHLELLQREGRPLTSVKRRLTALRSFFRWCVAKKYLAEDPSDPNLIRKLPAIRPEDRTVIFLSRTEARRLIDAAGAHPVTGARDRALIVALVFLALRRSEAAAMDTEHFHAVGGYTVLELPHTKGGRFGEVKVPSIVLREIQAYDDLSGPSRPLWRSFSNRNRGERLTPNMIYRIVRRLSQEAGLAHRIGAHALRHTACTLAIEGGAAVQQVQQHARHRSINTTIQYVHARDRLENNAVDYIKV